MKKPIFALTTLACIAVTGLVGCGGGSSSASGSNCSSTSDEGKVLNIWCWNTEFKGNFEKFYPDFVKTVTNGDTSYDLLRDGTKVNFIVHANDGNGYQLALDAALKEQDSKSADDKIDMFLIEADYATKYTASDYTLDVKGDIGLTDDDLAQQYQYTKDIVTSNGKLKGISWQATPGLYAYRRDIAKDVLGTDDPTEVQSKIDTWAKFNDVAAKMKAKEYKMISGYSDNYRPYSNNMSKPWVTDGVVSLDNNIKEWIKTTKDYADNGYCASNDLWSDPWKADQGPAGKTFGFFYSTWGINFTLAGNADPDKIGHYEAGKSLYGDYAVVQGPAAYYWGGSWLCACKGTDNKGLINKVMYDMTCSKSVSRALTLQTLDYTNNKAAMDEIANDTSYGSAFLGGQNHIALFAKAAEKIDMKNAGAYDQGCNEQMQNAMKDYFFNGASFSEAIGTFKTKLGQLYNNLTFDTSFDTL